MDALRQKFDDESMQNYRAAAKLGYHAVYYLDMVRDKGCVGAAKKLLETGPELENVQTGLNRLWELEKLGLSVEALVLKPEFAILFEKDELQTAYERLARLNWAGLKTINKPE